MIYINRYIIILCLILCSFEINSQEVSIRAENIPLRELLNELIETHKCQFSYDDRLIKDCRINLSKDYENPENALVDLLSLCNLDYKKINDVYIVRKKKESLTQLKNKPSFKQSGKIVDIKTKESLPFAIVQINGTAIYSDVDGQFSFVGKNNISEIHVSHLGYNSLDSLVDGSNNLLLGLEAASFGLAEVIVRDSSRLELYSSLSRSQWKLNPQTTSFLPGNSGNFIFNNLRLHPGILAAGEQVDDFTIWGSYKGESQIIFDGITLFKTSNFANDLGAVNSLLIKDIEIFKGGYNVDIGDRVGAVVNIVGYSGDKKKYRGKLNVDNRSINSVFNIPIAKRYAIQIGARKTYTDLFKIDKLIKKEGSVPETNFGDLNFKFSGETKKGDLIELNALGSKDEFIEDIEEETTSKKYFIHKDISVNQLGFSFLYKKKWKKGNFTHLNLSYSKLTSIYNNDLKVIDVSPPNEVEESANITSNSISQKMLRLDHYCLSREKQSWSLGFSFVQDRTAIERGLVNETTGSSDRALNRINMYIKDEIRITKKITVTPGLKVDFPLIGIEPKLQGRLNINYKPIKVFNVRLSAGRYQQFISKSSYVDKFDNHLYAWHVRFTGETIKGNHFVAELMYHKNNSQFKSDFYFKTTNGSLRFVPSYDTSGVDSSPGESRTYGMDLFFKQKIKKHEFWVTYTLSKTEDHFFWLTSDFTRSPQDQRHEVKAAGILNFKPFHFSLNYVYGSGMPNRVIGTMIDGVQVEVEDTPRYSRLDASFLYEKKLQKVKMETGCSVVNILNRKNVLFNNFSNFPESKTIYSNASPFAPSIFFNVSF